MKIAVIKEYDNLEQWEERMNAKASLLNAQYTQTHVFALNEGICYVGILFYQDKGTSKISAEMR